MIKICPLVPAHYRFFRTMHLPIGYYCLVLNGVCRDSGLSHCHKPESPAFAGYLLFNTNGFSWGQSGV
jgi:hypothetical protein